MRDAKETVLSADQHALAMKALRDMGGALSAIQDQLVAGHVIATEMTSNVLYVSEHYLADLGKAVGIETDGAKQIEERSAMLRTAHSRIRDLEQQLGNTMTPAAAQMQIKNLRAQLDKWWKLEGFGHVSEARFGAYGCEVEFSCMLFGGFSLLNSKTPVSDEGKKKSWYERLSERGFTLCGEDRDLVVVDCDASRQVLIDLLAKRLPSATVMSFKNHGIRDEPGFSLESVTVYIHDISNIAELPVDMTRVADIQA